MSSSPNSSSSPPSSSPTSMTYQTRSKSSAGQSRTPSPGPSTARSVPLHPMKGRIVWTRKQLDFMTKMLLHYPKVNKALAAKVAEEMDVEHLQVYNWWKKNRMGPKRRIHKHSSSSSEKYEADEEPSSHNSSSPIEEDEEISPISNTLIEEEEIHDPMADVPVEYRSHGVLYPSQKDLLTAQALLMLVQEPIVRPKPAGMEHVPSSGSHGSSASGSGLRRTASDAVETWA